MQFVFFRENVIFSINFHALLAYFLVRMAPKKNVPYEDLESGGDVYRRRKLYNGVVNLGIGTVFHPVYYANILNQVLHY